MKANPLLPLSPEPVDAASLEDFRISQPLEILTLLGRMAEQGEILSLSSEDGVSYLSAIDQVDRGRRLLWLRGAEGDERLQQLVQSREVVAVGYLDHVKIQFPALNLLWLPGPGRSQLSCLLPLHIYRFQRRLHARVRPPGPAVARVRLGAAAHEFELEVIDVSMTGIGLRLAPGGPLLEVGAQVGRASISLEPATTFEADLKVMHVTPCRPPRSGYHVGCTMSGVGEEALRALQRFIGKVQARLGAGEAPGMLDP